MKKLMTIILLAGVLMLWGANSAMANELTIDVKPCYYCAFDYVNDNGEVDLGEWDLDREGCLDSGLCFYPMLDDDGNPMLDDDGNPMLDVAILDKEVCSKIDDAVWVGEVFEWVSCDEVPAINACSKGVFAVAVLDFEFYGEITDVTLTVEEDVLIPIKSSLEYVDANDDLDTVFHFETPELCFFDWDKDADDEMTLSINGESGNDFARIFRAGNCSLCPIPSEE
jgi:hypothetical protein